MSYPPPSYAATIWLVGDQLMLSFPSPEHARNHTVAIPTTDKGFTALVSILKNRDSGPNWIGTKGAPTGMDLAKALESDKAFNEWLKKQGHEKAQKDADAEALASELEELGLL